MNKKRKTAIIVSVVILLVVSLTLTLTSCAPKVYKLNFDVDGAVVKTIDIPSVGTPELPDTPVKSGYTFAGWYFDKATLSDPCTAETIANKQFTADTVAYAKWLKNDYSIEYKLDGGENAKANPSGYVADTVAITLADPAKLGYTFGGWYGEDTFVTKVTEIAKGSTGNKTLYAKWTKDSYTIAYVLDGGTEVTTNPTTYAIDTVTFTLATPSKIDYSFGGWYGEADFSGTAITEIATGSTGNKTLYAKWTAVVYTIKYVTNCATTVADTTYDILTMPNSFATLTREGYVFEGWYDNTDIECNVITAITKDNIGNKILVAKWTKNNYTIVYNLNEGIDGNNPSRYAVDTPTIMLNAPTKVGYTFGGWFGEADFSDTAITEIATGSTGNKTLFAKWIIINYEIKYTGVEGATNTNPTTYNVESGTINIVAPTKAGYTFTGWSGTDLDGVANKTFTILAKSTGIREYVAHWTKDTYTITYELNGGSNGANPTTYAVDTATFTLNAPTKLGYTFGGWYGKVDFSGTAITEIATGSTGNKTLYAKLTKDSYSIAYVLNGGTNGANPTTYAVDTVTIKLADPSKIGYTFGGWFGKTDFDGAAITEIAKGSTGNKTLFAKWIIINYDIKYTVVEGATNTNPTTYNVASGAINIVAPTKLGYTFTGWSGTDLVGAVNMTFTILAKSTGIREYVAHWTKDTYTITYNLNGGTEVTTNPTTYAVDTATITLSAPSKVGYTFGGWYDNAEFKGNAIAAITKGSTGNKTLYARWTAIEYKITYNLNGGENAKTNPTTYTIESATITLTAPTKLGYTFGGWFGEANFSGTAITEIAIDSTGNKTLYAKWTATNYDITYNLDGGTNSLDNPNKYTIESGAINIVAPTKVGYTFTGWSGTDLGGATNKTFTILAESTGIREYTAHWTKDSYTITYTLNGGSEVTANPTTYSVDTATFTLNAPTKLGYTFGGWFGEANFSGTAVTEIAIGSTGNKTLYAKWNINTYTITYVGADGVGAINPNATIATYTFESNTITLAPATWKKGAEFVGWSADGNVANAKLTPTINKNSTGNVTFTAHWTFTEYAITYDHDGGTNWGGNPSSYNIDTATITLKDPRHTESATFVGWYKSATGNDKITTIDRGSTGAMTIYARWNYYATTGLAYTLINGDTEYEVSKGTVESGVVTIPRRHDNKLVAKIAANAFSHLPITGVHIPNGVKSIGGDAFCNCKSLMDVTIPESVTSIGEMAFGLCDSLRTAMLPKDLKIIPQSMFSFCFALYRVRMPLNVETIGGSAFNTCRRLKDIDIPSTLTSIGIAAFVHCEILQSIFIPKSVTMIGSSAFDNCWALSIYCEIAATAVPKPVGNPNTTGWHTQWMGDSKPVAPGRIFWGQTRPTTTP